MHTYSSLEALLPCSRSGFWRWICKSSLHSNKDQCLHLSITIRTCLESDSISNPGMSESTKQASPYHCLDPPSVHKQKGNAVA